MKIIQKTLPIKTIINYFFLLIKVYLTNFIKQLNPPFFLLVIPSILISSSPFAKQENPFTDTANIYSIVQDKKDFIWLSGQNGLYRFDGTQTINFTKNNINSPIPFNWVNGITVKDEQLILATETKGLWLFNPNIGTTTPIKVKSASDTFYTAIHHKDSFYAISMTIPHNFYRYKVTTGETTILMRDIKNSLLIASDNRIYVNDNKKLYYIEDTLNVPKIRQVEEINERIVDAEKVGDSVVLASKNSLFKLSDTGKIIKEKTLSSILAIARSNNNQSFLLLTLLEQSSKGTLKHYKNKKILFQMLRSQYIKIYCMITLVCCGLSAITVLLN